MSAIPVNGQTIGNVRVEQETWPPVVTLVAALFVAGVLLLASAAKVIPEGGGSFGAQLGYLEWWHFAIIISQVVISVAVVRWHRRWETWLGVMMLFSLFAGYSGYANARGISCGCFGTWLESSTVFRLDLLAILLGGVLAWRPSKPGGAVATLATVSMFMATVGAASGATFLPPPPEADTAMRFMALPVVDEAREAGPDDPAYLLYIYSEDCPTCQRHLPPMEAYMASHPNDDVLRLKTISMEMLEAEYGLEIWRWDAKPTTLLVEGGVITKSYSLNDLPNPEQVRSALSGESDPFATLLDLDMMSDLRAAGPDDPATLVYLYNPNCPTCIEHLVVFEDYLAQRPADDVMRVRVISMLDLEEQHGIPLYLWTPPQTILMQGGEITSRYNEDSTPDPFDVLRELIGH